MSATGHWFAGIRSIFMERSVCWLRPGSRRFVLTGPKHLCRMHRQALCLSAGAAKADATPASAERPSCRLEPAFRPDSSRAPDFTRLLTETFQNKKPIQAITDAFGPDAPDQPNGCRPAQSASAAAIVGLILLFTTTHHRPGRAGRGPASGRLSARPARAAFQDAGRDQHRGVSCKSKEAFEKTAAGDTRLQSYSRTNWPATIAMASISCHRRPAWRNMARWRI